MKAYKWIKGFIPAKKSQQLIIGKCFYAYTSLKHIEYFLLPKNFDIEKLLVNYPPEEHGFPAGKEFKKERIYQFVGLISSLPARNNDLIDEKGYVPIMMSILRDSDKDFTFYKNYLLNTKIIISDKYYSPGYKATGYRWSEEFSNSRFVYKAIKSTLADEVHKWKDSPIKAKYPYLFHWYDKKELIISPKAQFYAHEVKEIKMQDTTKHSWNLNKDSGRYKYPVTQYYAALLNIGKLEQKIYDEHLDDNIHRLHSVLTYLQKDYRNFITYEGNELCGVDVKNCQPYLSCLILNRVFWDENSSLPLGFYDLPDNIQDYFPATLIEEIKRYLDTLLPEKFNVYINDASSGNIYEKICQVINKKLGANFNRDEAKTTVFCVLFSSNQGSHSDEIIQGTKRIFENEIYPEIGGFFRLIKKKYKGIKDKQYNRLSVLLQAIESTIILHNCCRKIWIERGAQVPVFTIHDSIITLPEYKDYVHDIMHGEFTRIIGVPPKLSEEEWKQENLDQNILSQIDNYN